VNLHQNTVVGQIAFEFTMIRESLSFFPRKTSGRRSFSDGGLLICFVVPTSVDVVALVHDGMQAEASSES
jgi:hypothetical protein